MDVRIEYKDLTSYRTTIVSYEVSGKKLRLVKKDNVEIVNLQDVSRVIINGEPLAI